MAHPKRKTSKTRRDKRRTHYKATAHTNIVACQETGEPHLTHRAYVVDGNLYYNGKMLIENYQPVA